MLRFGSVLLAGLLVLSSCSQGNNSADKAKTEIKEACKHSKPSYWENPEFTTHLQKAVVLDNKYLPYLEKLTFLVIAEHSFTTYVVVAQYESKIIALCSVNKD